MLKVIILLSFFLVSCAGYRFTDRENPFAQYGISSISIPMFYNHSNFDNISPKFTAEIYKLLTSFKDLRVYSGDKNTDAVMIGILASPLKFKEARENTQLRIAKQIAPSVIGDNRGDFYIPAQTTLSLTLRIIVIKKPSKEEIALLQSELGEQVLPNSKVIFNEFISLREGFTRETYDGENRVVNMTKNIGAEKDATGQMAMNAANSFKDMILYAF